MCSTYGWVVFQQGYLYTYETFSETTDSKYIENEARHPFVITSWLLSEECSCNLSRHSGIRFQEPTSHQTLCESPSGRKISSTNATCLNLTGGAFKSRGCPWNSHWMGVTFPPSVDLKSPTSCKQALPKWKRVNASYRSSHATISTYRYDWEMTVYHGR